MKTAAEQMGEGSSQQVWKWQRLRQEWGKLLSEAHVCLEGHVGELNWLPIRAMIWNLL